MITEYHFSVDTAELLWELQWPMPGVSTTVKHSGSLAREVAVMTVKEGIDAGREMANWQGSSAPFEALDGTLPSWFFWPQ